MFRVASLVAVLTILSKVLGLVRDLVVAHYYGTSTVSDAYNLAYQFTGNIFVVFGCLGGPFYNSIVSVLPKFPNAEPVSTRKWLYSVMLKSSLIFVALALIIYLAKDYILSLFINAEIRPEYFKLCKYNIDLLLPMILITAPIGIISAVLNVYKRYVEPSFSPAMMSIVLVAAIFFMGDANSALALALGTTLGGVLSLVYQLPAYFQIFKNPGRETDLVIPNEARADYYKVLYPALFTTAISQILVFVDSFFCKDLAEGSWTAITLGNRLIQMPLGVLLTAIMVPLFPRISQLAGSGNIAAIKSNIYRALKYLFALAIPGTILGFFFTEDIIRMVFERGAFDARSTQMVSTVVFWLLFSIIPYILKDTLVRVFYSFNDSKTPLLVSFIAIVAKFFANYLFVYILHWGLMGISLSTTIISILNFLILYLALKIKIPSIINKSDSP